MQVDGLAAKSGCANHMTGQAVFPLRNLLVSLEMRCGVIGFANLVSADTQMN